MKRARSPGRIARRALVGVLVLGLVSPGVGAGAQEVPPPATPPDTAAFAVDPGIPLDVEVGETSNRDGYRRTELSWASPAGGRVPAWLYLPTGPGPHPAVLLQHGMPGTRSSIHPLAEAYARAGAVVLAPTASFARPDPLYRDAALFVLPTLGEGDRSELMQTVQDLRRAVDVLTGLPEVDPERLAFVGLSYGGWAGAVLSGVEERIVAYGLMVAPTSFAERMLRDEGGIDTRQFRDLEESRRNEWLSMMESLDGRRYVASAAPARLRFDVATDDELVPLEDALSLAAAGSEPKVVRRWKAGHALVPEAFADQARWLAPILGIDTTRFVPPDFRRGG